MTANNEWEDSGGQLSGLGPIASLEEMLEEHYGLPFALAMSSATTGLLAVALAADLRDAEIITTPYTWGGSIAPWMILGNRPVFADIDPLTLTLDAADVGRRVTRATKAILAVDIHGNPCDDRALREVADSHGILYIADAAQSLGATRQGRPASSLADALVVSFTTGKRLAAGEGGAVVTGREDLYRRLILLSQHPSRQGRELGMSERTELAPINGRMHPATAVRLGARWPMAARSLPAWQRRCQAALDGLADGGLTAPAPFAARGISPSFTKVTAAWTDDSASR